MCAAVTKCAPIRYSQRHDFSVPAGPGIVERFAALRPVLLIMCVRVQETAKMFLEENDWDLDEAIGETLATTGGGAARP